MTVREQAYNETYAWLENSNGGPPPVAPADLHPIAAEEWKAGCEAAHKAFVAEEDEFLNVVEDLVVFVVKSTVLFSIMGVVYWIHEPYSMITGGLITLWLLWRWL